MSISPTVEQVEGNEYYRVEYRRDSASNDLQGRLQYSPDPGLWKDAIDGQAGVIIQTDSDYYGSGIDRVVVWIPINGLDRMFTRFAVSDAN